MRLHFRTVLIAAMLVILLGTVSIVSVTSFLSARETAESLTEQVLTHAAERTEDGAKHLLQIASSQAALDAALLGTGRIDPRDPDAVGAYFAAAIAAHPELSSLSWVRDENGELIEAERDRDGAVEVLLQTRQATGGTLLRRFVVAGGTPRELEPVVDAQAREARTRPYYLAAASAKQPTWTETYLFVGKEGRATTPGVTRATPIYKPDGTLLGVLSADFDLYALSDFARALDVGRNGAVFVIELRTDGSRRVIAGADPSLLTTASGEAIAADHIADPRIVGFLGAFAGSFARAKPETLMPVAFDVNGVRYVGAYRLLLADRGLRWAVALVLPESDILGPIEKSRRNTIAIAVVATLLAVLIAVAIATTFGGALRSLAHETEEVGRFRLEPHPIVESSVLEIRTLSAAIEDMKRGLRSFSKFVPADLVRRLVESGDEAVQGGKRRTITVHFSDIAGFTSFSERLSPEELVELLTEYLSLVSHEIIASGGTLDKYIGDAVMAFWNAPSDVADHAFVACCTALSNRGKLALQREVWLQAGKPAIACRVGIHTGEAVVGNVGSEARLDFTAIGDTVNLASRLEGLGKVYGVDIVISESTLRELGDRVVVRLLDRVAVKGRAGGILIYELIGLKTEVDVAMVRAAARHDRAIEAYFAQQWQEALALLTQAPTDDLAAALLVRRIERLRAHPPGADWDGVERMTTK